VNKGPVLALACTAFAAAAAAQTITEIALPAGSAPAGITSGPDGNVWFVEERRDRIGRLSPTGILTEFPIAVPGSFARDIVTGPDGNLWFTELTGRIGRITPSGVVTESMIPLRPAEPISIVAGSDGNLWFTDYYDRIGRLTTSGIITYFVLAPGSGPRDITRGPDGAVWFTETNTGKIGRAAPDGTFDEFTLPASNSGPNGITTGPDGNLWFTEISTSRIGRLTPSGALTEFPLAGGAQPYGIAAGADGNLWFTESALDRVGRITPAGVVTEFPVTPGSGPNEITAGPDGGLWFSEFDGNRIGHVSLRLSCGADPSALCLNGARFEARLSWSVPSQGTSGQGQPVPLTSDTGAYWFFTSNNIEVIVKVVDGRAYNGKYWVFVGALTDVQYVLTVRDVVTGAVRTYSHPSGTLESFADTSAF
jgi:streptogramin lyase